MGGFVKGQVVIVPFPFANLTGMKKRPALVVAPLRGDDLILCQITTVGRVDDYIITLNNNDFAKGSLPHPSFIRCDHLFTADSSLIIRPAGMLTKRKIQEVISKIIGILSIETD